MKTKKPGRWFKRDIALMTDALRLFAHEAAPIGGLRRSEQTACAARLTEILTAHRIDIIIADFASQEAYHLESAARNRACAESAPITGAWGASTDEMIARFHTHAQEAETKASRYTSLIARIRAEGLPPEVLEFDPRTQQPQ